MVQRVKTLQLGGLRPDKSATPSRRAILLQSCSRMVEISICKRRAAKATTFAAVGCSATSATASGAKWDSAHCTPRPQGSTRGSHAPEAQLLDGIDPLDHRRKTSRTARSSAKDKTFSEVATAYLKAQRTIGKTPNMPRNGRRASRRTRRQSPTCRWRQSILRMCWRS